LVAAVVEVRVRLARLNHLEQIMVVLEVREQRHP
jgi:hypothetical protein